LNGTFATKSKRRVKKLKTLRKVALWATVAALVIPCTTPQVGQAYAPEARQNRTGSTQPFAYLKEDRALASAYFTPKRSDYASYEAYREATRMNGTGITHYNDKANIGTLAADIEHYPRGTKIRVFIGTKDYGIWTVKDIGPAIKNRTRHIKARDEDGEIKKVTLWNRFDMHVGEGKRAGRLANKLGMFVIRIYVLEWGKG
jgi:3D (Asp-Asp-Asp) domain-containing protein